MSTPRDGSQRKDTHHGGDRIPGCGRDVDETLPSPLDHARDAAGAGKTTLVNHILQGSHGKKIAVIENEYGWAHYTTSSPWATR